MNSQEGPKQVESDIFKLKKSQQYDQEEEKNFHTS